MADPLSIAGSVAGLVSLAGVASKAFYQFFMSIYNAPAAVRELATALFTLNVALGQVQETLLDPRFVASSDDKQVASLQNCLSNCTAIFREVQLKAERAGLAGADITIAKKAWESIKWSFNEEEIDNHLRRVEAEKTTLLLIVDIFTARLGANILGQVAETKALVQKQDRRLKDIHVFCQWVVGQNTRGHDSSQSGGQIIETSAFAASSAYDEGDIARLLQSSGSVLSLTLGEPVDETLGAVWTPDPVSRVPLRRAITTAIAGSQHTDRQGNYIRNDKTVSLSSPGLGGSFSILHAIASANGFLESNKQRFSPRRTPHVLSLARNPIPGFTASSLLPFGDLLRKASDISKDMMGDLKYFQATYAMIEKYTTDGDTDGVLRERVEALSHAINEYLLFAGKLLNPEPGKSRALQDIRMIIKAEPNENERKRLYAVYLNEYEALKQTHAFVIAKQTMAMQKEQLDLQRQQAADMRALFERNSLASAANTADSPSINPGQSPESGLGGLPDGGRVERSVLLRARGSS